MLEEAINYLSKVETSHENEVLNDYREMQCLQLLQLAV